MTWNPVLKKVKEVGQIVPLEAWKTYNWAEWIENASDELKELFKPIQTTQLGDLVLFRYGNYSDLFSGEAEIEYGDFWNAHNGFYTECRSVVIDIRNMELVSTPFKKFLNYGEGINTPEYIEHLFNTAETIEVSDKLDGSMCVASWYKGKIIVHSSKALDPENSWRLADMKRMIEEHEGIKEGIRMFNHITFIFEYISAADAHVVNYTKEQEGLWLIGARNKNNGMEFPYFGINGFAKVMKCRMPFVMSRSLEQILENLQTLTADKAEGYVVNFYGHKVKFKTDDYVHLHRILGQLSSPNIILEHIADDTFDDFFAKIPETHKNRVWKIAQEILKYGTDISKQVDLFHDIAPKTSRKDFMIWVDAKVPKEIKGYVRQKYLGQDYNVFKNGKSYKKASHILPEDE